MSLIVIYVANLRLVCISPKKLLWLLLDGLIVWAYFLCLVKIISTDALIVLKLLFSIIFIQALTNRVSVNPEVSHEIWSK